MAGTAYSIDYKVVEKLPYTWSERKKLLEHFHCVSLPVPYEAYLEQIVEWGTK